MEDMANGGLSIHRMLWPDKDGVAEIQLEMQTTLSQLRHDIMHIAWSGFKRVILDGPHHINQTGCFEGSSESCPSQKEEAKASARTTKVFTSNHSFLALRKMRNWNTQTKRLLMIIQ